MALIARVTITLKNGVLDPQGVATQTALNHIGFQDIESVQQGKIIDIKFSHQDHNRAQQEVEAMSEQLLANMVIENFEISWIEQ